MTPNQVHIFPLALPPTRLVPTKLSGHHKLSETEEENLICENKSLITDTFSRALNILITIPITFNTYHMK